MIDQASAPEPEEHSPTPEAAIEVLAHSLGEASPEDREEILNTAHDKLRPVGVDLNDLSVHPQAERIGTWTGRTRQQVLIDLGRQSLRQRAMLSLGRGKIPSKRRPPDPN